MLFEEALYKGNINCKMYSIEEINYIRANDPELFARIKNHLYCPECEKPHLSHKDCSKSGKNNHFSTYKDDLHEEYCSFNINRASSKQLEKLQNDNDEDLNKLQNRLKDCIIALFTEKKPPKNPLIIETDSRSDKLNKSLSTNKTSSKKYYIPRKRLTNGLTDEDTGIFKIFYGYVRIVCKKFYSGYKLFMFNPLNQNQPMLCSIYLSDKVFSHLYLSENEITFCQIAFFANLEKNISKKNGKEEIYFNGTLTDSRKMFFLKKKN